MKNLFCSFLTVMTLVLMAFSMEAQQVWEWESYEVRIDLPDDFKVIKNTDNEFEAVGDGMEIYMFIFEGDISLDEMKDATLEAASDMGLGEVDAVQDISTRGFEGKYVAGYLEGDAVLFCGLINPKNITNFFAVVTFDDEDDIAEEDAFKILQSIRKR